jgi:hypothetical protein
MTYNYFIPIIHLGPIGDYTFTQELPLNEIKNLILGKNAKLEIIRTVILNNNKIHEKKEVVFLKNNKWLNNEDASFKWSPPLEQKSLCYIETQINLLKGKGLTSSSLPGFYVNYTSPQKKNFISCGNEKYGNPRVIMQMKYFGMWSDGYPAISVNKEKKTTYSLIIINPYKTLSSFVIEINSLKIKKIFKVSGLSVKRINFYNLINKEAWTGQFYIYGKRRAIIYLINHAFDNLNIVSTLEHSDPFRAEYTYQPRLQYLRNKIHKKINTFFKNI